MLEVWDGNLRILKDRWFEISVLLCEVWSWQIKLLKISTSLTPGEKSESLTCRLLVLCCQDFCGVNRGYLKCDTFARQRNINTHHTSFKNKMRGFTSNINLVQEWKRNSSCAHKDALPFSFPIVPSDFKYNQNCHTCSVLLTLWCYWPLAVVPSKWTTKNVFEAVQHCDRQESEEMGVGWGMNCDILSGLQCAAVVTSGPWITNTQHVAHFNMIVASSLLQSYLFWDKNVFGLQKLGFFACYQTFGVFIQRRVVDEKCTLMENVSLCLTRWHNLRADVGFKNMNVDRNLKTGDLGQWKIEFKAQWSWMCSWICYQKTALESSHSFLPFSHLSFVNLPFFWSVAKSVALEFSQYIWYQGKNFQILWNSKLSATHGGFFSLTKELGGANQPSIILCTFLHLSSCTTLLQKWTTWFCIMLSLWAVWY